MPFGLTFFPAYITMEHNFPYVVTIETDRDGLTLDWLADHGYDGSFLEHADIIESGEDEDGYVVAPIVYGLSEPAAWTFREDVEADPGAFLACCGSHSLRTALEALLSEIV